MNTQVRAIIAFGFFLSTGCTLYDAEDVSPIQSTRPDGGITMVTMGPDGGLVPMTMMSDGTPADIDTPDSGSKADASEVIDQTDSGMNADAGTIEVDQPDGGSDGGMIEIIDDGTDTDAGEIITIDAGQEDAGTVVTTDAGNTSDAGVDAGTAPDAGTDAGSDAGTVTPHPVNCNTPVTPRSDTDDIAVVQGEVLVVGPYVENATAGITRVEYTINGEEREGRVIFPWDETSDQPIHIEFHDVRWLVTPPPLDIDQRNPEASGGRFDSRTNKWRWGAQYLGAEDSMILLCAEATQRPANTRFYTEMLRFDGLRPNIQLQSWDAENQRYVDSGAFCRYSIDHMDHQIVALPCAGFAPPRGLFLPVEQVWNRSRNNYFWISYFQEELAATMCVTTDVATSVWRNGQEVGWSRTFTPRVCFQFDSQNFLRVGFGDVAGRVTPGPLQYLHGHFAPGSTTEVDVRYLPAE